MKEPPLLTPNQTAWHVLVNPQNPSRGHISQVLIAAQ
jgi:hypothetical protein